MEQNETTAFILVINKHPIISSLCLRAPEQPSVDRAGQTPPGPGPLSRLSPLGRTQIAGARRDRHRALSLLPRHTTLLCLTTYATAKCN